MGAVVRAATQPKILIPLLFTMAYVAALASGGWRAGVWYPSMIKATVVWFVSSGFALFFNLNSVLGQPTFFRRKVLSLLAPSVFVEYLLNFFAFSFFAELILQPVLAVLVMLSIVASKDPQYRRVKPLVDTLLALAGISVLCFTVFQFIRLWEQLDGQALALNFALPVWLTIGILPFIYLIAIYARYEQSFTRINFLLSTSETRSRRRVKVALLTALTVRLRHVGEFGGKWVTEAGAAGSFAATQEVIRRFLASKHEENKALEEKQARLVRYTGVLETDCDGRQLDRREFKETIDALNWLSSCQRGWHNQIGKYRDDLIQFLKPGFQSKGLPDQHGITMHVAEDGQAWWAWRRTITGWCFAVGAAGPPPDQWEFDGAEPPTGFPGQDHRWGDEPFSLDFNRNWLYA